MFGSLQRSYYRTRVHAPLARFFDAPPPSARLCLKDVEFLALDLELTGVDPIASEIVSIGFVPIKKLQITLSEAQRIRIRPKGQVFDSATIHLLRDQDLFDGATMVDGMDRILRALTGRVLLVHFAGLDVLMLSKACRACFGGPLLSPYVDTLALARRRLFRQGREPTGGSLRLPALRRQYGLPKAKLHGALSDAVATAELFLAMVAHGDGPNARLRSIL